MKTTILMMLLAGIILLAACKNSGSSYSSSAADTVAKMADDSPKLVKTGEMQLKVKNVEQAAETVSELTALYNGMVMHHQMQSTIADKQDITLSSDSLMKMTVYHTNADMTVKIPSENVEEFMDKLNHLSVFIDQRKMDIEDRTLDYLSSKLKTQNRNRALAQQKQMKMTMKVDSAQLALADDAVDRQIGNLRTNDAVKYSVINLNLYQSNTISKEVVANDDLSGYNTSLPNRAGLALSRGWYYFSALVLGLLNLWAFILAGSGVWIAIRLYKRKKQDKPLQTS